MLVANFINQVPPPEQFYAQLHVWLTLKIDERPIALKASHLVEIMGSQCHLPISNMEGVVSVPPDLSQALHQDGTSRRFC